MYYIKIERLKKHFVRSGAIWGPNFQFLFDLGRSGSYQSSRASSKAENAIYFIFNHNYVAPGYGYERYRGYSLRCLAS